MRFGLRRVRGLGVQGPDAEYLPRLLLGPEDWLGLENLGIARPGSSAALDRVGDVDVVAGFEEKLLPAGPAIRLGFPGDAREAAAVPHEQRILGARIRPKQLHVLHVHLLDLEIAVRVDLERRRAGCEDDLLARQPGERGLPAADVKAADLGHGVVAFSHAMLAALMRARREQNENQSALTPLDHDAS